MSAVLCSLRRTLEQRYGLALEGLTEEQIESALSSALAAPGGLEPSDPRLLQLVLDRLPIDESWFFRDEALWTWLRAELGPALLARAAIKGRVVRALSLGCSSGQEAFSLAILFQGLLEAVGIPGSSAAGFVEITGLDSSPARIEQARDGVVNGWSVQRCRPEWLRGRVASAAGDDMRMRVDASIRAMCRFDLGNVLDLAAQGKTVLGAYDLVLCRNVLIYFRADRAAHVVASLGDALEAGAVLVVSATEAHLLGMAPCLEPLDHLGAARARSPGFPAVDDRPGATARRLPKNDRQGTTARRRLTAARTRAGRSTPKHPPARAAVARAAPRERRLAEEHLHRALEHAGAGRGADALREARAALFLEPGHLFLRLLLGRELLSHDRERGREVLRTVLEQTSLLPPEADVPFAPGLSVAQLASAARLLLEVPEVP
jgi:chemotaxis protein methyltransferase CheR